jgi:hypothetical protein
MERFYSDFIAILLLSKIYFHYSVGLKLLWQCYLMLISKVLPGINCDETFKIFSNCQRCISGGTVLGLELGDKFGPKKQILVVFAQNFAEMYMLNVIFFND